MTMATPQDFVDIPVQGKIEKIYRWKRPNRTPLDDKQTAHPVHRFGVHTQEDDKWTWELSQNFYGQLARAFETLEKTIPKVVDEIRHLVPDAKNAKMLEALGPAREKIYQVCQAEMQKRKDLVLKARRIINGCTRPADPEDKTEELIRYHEGLEVRAALRDKEPLQILEAINKEIVDKGTTKILTAMQDGPVPLLSDQDLESAARLFVETRYPFLLTWEEDLIDGLVHVVERSHDAHYGVIAMLTQAGVSILEDWEKTKFLEAGRLPDEGPTRPEPIVAEGHPDLGDLSAQA